MTEPHKLTDLVPVEVLTEVNTAIAVLEIQGPAITEALRQLDRATTVAWKAMHMLGVTDDEWDLVKRDIGIERGWDAAYQLVSTLDLPEHAAVRRRNGRRLHKRSFWCQRPCLGGGGRPRSQPPTAAGGVRLPGAAGSLAPPDSR